MEIMTNLSDVLIFKKKSSNKWRPKHAGKSINNLVYRHSNGKQFNQSIIYHRLKIVFCVPVENKH